MFKAMALSLLGVFCWGVRAELPGPPPPATNLIGRIVWMRTTQAQSASDLLLVRPDVCEADKQDTRRMVETLRKAADDIVARAKGPNADIERLSKEASSLIKLVEAFFQGHPDLMWIVLHQAAIGGVEDRLLDGQGDKFFDVLKGLGVVDPALGECRRITQNMATECTKLTSDFKQAVKGLDQKNYAAIMKLKDDYEYKTGVMKLAAIKAIRAKLTEDQRAAMDWVLYRQSEGAGPGGAPLILGFSRQFPSVKAPEDGKFVLRQWADNSPNEGKAIETVELKKGQLIGFRKNGQTVVAFANDREFSVPAGGAMFYWALVSAAGGK